MSAMDDFSLIFRLARTKHTSELESVGEKQTLASANVSWELPISVSDEVISLSTRTENGQLGSKINWPNSSLD